MDELARRVAARLKRKFMRVYVFGSRASGNARPDSDVDIIVVDPVFRGKTLLERTDIVISNLRDFVDKGVVFDIISLTPEEFEDLVSRKTNIVGHVFARGEVVEA